MKLSARNVLKGKVKNISTGVVNSEVVIELPGGEIITSIVTKTSVDSLKLKEGSSVYAIIKASSVIVGTDWPQFRFNTLYLIFNKILPNFFTMLGQKRSS